MAYTSPTAVSKSNYTKGSANDKNLAIFIPDNSNLEKSVKDFVHLYSQRTKADKEYWLVDIMAWPDIYNVMEDFKDIPLDYDDDLFFYIARNAENGTVESLAIYEFYEIHESKPRKILSYGKWTIERGLILSIEDKWNRRKDLEVLYNNLFYYMKISILDYTGY